MTDRMGRPNRTRDIPHPGGTQLEISGSQAERPMGVQESLRKNSLAPKTSKQVNALVGLMPNLGGLRTSTRRMHAVLSGLLYGVSVWKEKARSSPRIKTTHYNNFTGYSGGRRIIRAYKTISFAAASIFAEIPPAELLPKSQTDVYR